MKERKLLESFFHLMFTVKTELTDKLVVHDITIAPMHIKLLKLLSIKAPCTAQHLSQSLARDKAQINRLVKDLLAANLISRSPNPDDKRSQLLDLQPEAQDILKQMQIIERDIMARMCHDVSVEDQQAFIALADKFKHNLQNQT